jgi:hypothetical protein
MMFAWGIAAFIVGITLAAFGLFGDTTVASSSSFGAAGRTHNIGLLGQQAALITLGGGFMIVGAVFIAAATLVARLDNLMEALKQERNRVLLNRHDNNMKYSVVMAAAPFSSQESASSPDQKYPPEAWDDSEARALKMGYSIYRGKAGLEIRNSIGLNKIFATPNDAHKYLGLPPG